MRMITLGATALAASLALSGAAFAQAKSTGSNMGNSNTQMKGSGMTQGGMGAAMGEDGMATTGTTARGMARSGEMGEMRSSTRSKGQMGAASRSQKAKAAERRRTMQRPATTGTISGGGSAMDAESIGGSSATGMGSGRR